jgi:hypothetical protein
MLNATMAMLVPAALSTSHWTIFVPVVVVLALIAAAPFITSATNACVSHAVNGCCALTSLTAIIMLISIVSSGINAPSYVSFVGLLALGAILLVVLLASLSPTLPSARPGKGKASMWSTGNLGNLSQLMSLFRSYDKPQSSVMLSVCPVVINGDQSKNTTNVHLGLPQGLFEPPKKPTLEPSPPPSRTQPMLSFNDPDIPTPQIPEKREVHGADYNAKVVPNKTGGADVRVTSTAKMGELLHPPIDSAKLEQYTNDSSSFAKTMEVVKRFTAAANITLRNGARANFKPVITAGRMLCPLASILMSFYMSDSVPQVQTLAKALVNMAHGLILLHASTPAVFSLILNQVPVGMAMEGSRPLEGRSVMPRKSAFPLPHPEIVIKDLRSFITNWEPFTRDANRLPNSLSDMEPIFLLLSISMLKIPIAVASISEAGALVCSAMGIKARYINSAIIFHAHHFSALVKAKVPNVLPLEVNPHIKKWWALISTLATNSNATNMLLGAAAAQASSASKPIFSTSDYADAARAAGGSDFIDLTNIDDEMSPKAQAAPSGQQQQQQQQQQRKVPHSAPQQMAQADLPQGLCTEQPPKQPPPPQRADALEPADDSDDSSAEPEDEESESDDSKLIDDDISVAEAMEMKTMNAEAGVSSRLRARAGRAAPPAAGTAQPTA